MQPVLSVLKGSDLRRRYKPPARPYHLFYYTGFVNTFTENGRTFYPYPPLRGASFYRKEGVSMRAPSLGRGCRAQRGGVGFLFGRRSRLLFAFPIGKGVVSRKAASSFRSLPHWGRGTAPAVDRVLSLMAHLRRSPSLFFIPFPPFNLRPFLWKEGVSTRAPSLGRGCRAQRGGVGFLFLAAKPPPLCLPPLERRCVEKSGIPVS